ncbi:MAG: DUF2905 domain-containing protein [Firmicutes bacterium]|nr:DUF2905 domain-containing protein [Bacillota bacterium]
MGEWGQMAKLIIIAGIVLVAVGLIMLGLGRGFPLGRLPGDFLFQKGNFTVYFPLVSMLIVSVVLTLILNWIARR